VNALRLNPRQTGRYSIYLPRRDERPSWPWCWLYTEMVYLFADQVADPKFSTPPLGPHNKPRLMALTIPIADAIKLFTKEEKWSIPSNSKFFLISPVIIIILALYSAGFFCWRCAQYKFTLNSCLQMLTMDVWRIGKWYPSWRPILIVCFPLILCTILIYLLTYILVLVID